MGDPFSPFGDLDVELDRAENGTISLKWMFIITLGVILLSTRLVTSLNPFQSRPVAVTGSKSSTVQVFWGAQAVPYWVPYYGHIVNLLFNADWFLTALLSKSTYTQAFSVVLLGHKHTILVDESGAKQVIDIFKAEQTRTHESDAKDSKPTLFDDVTPLRWVRQNMFGMPTTQENKWGELDKALREAYKEGLGDSGSSTTSSRSELTRRLERNIKRSMVNFVTFNESVVDQNDWEREMGLEVHASGGDPKKPSYVNANFLRLFQNYVLATLVETLLECPIPDNYESFQEDIRIVVDGWDILTSRLPRVFPVARGTRAHLARRRLLNTFIGYHQSLARLRKGESEESRDTSSDDWKYVDGVSNLVSTIHQVCVDQNLFKTQDDGIRAAAAETLYLLTSLYSRMSGLAYWAIVSIQADRSFLDQVRAASGHLESGIQVTAFPPVGFYNLPLEVELDASKLMNPDGPASRSSLTGWINWVGHVRSREWVSLKANEDVHISTSEGCHSEGKASEDKSGYLVRKDEWVDIPIFDLPKLASPLLRGKGLPSGIDSSILQTFTLTAPLPYALPSSRSAFGDQGLVALVATFIALWDIGAPRVENKEYLTKEDDLASQLAIPAVIPPNSWNSCGHYLVALPGWMGGETLACIMARRVDRDAHRKNGGILLGSSI